MKIDRVLFGRPMTATYAPPWPCPHCGGKLTLIRESFLYDETNASKHQRKSEFFDHWKAEYCFSAMLSCAACRQSTACCGSGGIVEQEFMDEDDEIRITYKDVFYPKYFSRPIAIFTPPTKCPASVLNCIQKSFAVFFCDVGASANHVRQCAEEILAHAGIVPKSVNGRFIPLGQRINSFEKLDPDNAGLVSALRWIGNFGSHPDTLNREDVFKAYEILELLLEELYVSHRKHVLELAKRINDAEGPVK